MLKRVKKLLGDDGVRGTLLTLTLRVCGAGLGFFSHIAYARFLGQEAYGVFAYFWVWVVVLGTLSQLGFATANTRFVAQYQQRNHQPRIRKLFSFANLMTVTAGAVCGAVFYFADTRLSTWPEWVGTMPAYIVAFSIPVFAMGESQRGYARGYGWNVLAYQPAFLERPLLALAIALAIFFAFGSVSVSQLLAAYLVALCLTVLLQFLRIKRNEPKPERKRTAGTHGKRWLSIALPLVVVDAYFIMSANMDVIVLKHFAEPSEVAVYFAATKIAALVYFLPAIAGAQAAPRLAKLYAKDEMGELAKVCRKFALLQSIPTVGAMLGIAVLGEWLLKLYGPGFEAGWTAMMILVSGIFVQAIAGPVRYLLAMTNSEKIMAVVMGASFFLNAALNLMLIPEFGILGAAAATALSSIGFTIALCIVAWKRLGIWPGIGPIPV